MFARLTARFSAVLLAVSLPFLLPVMAWASASEVIFPSSGFSAAQLAVVVNERDALSVEIAAYYQQQRGIPEHNILRVSFDPGESVMSPGVFAVMKKQLDRATPPQVQAYVVTWAAPYRVGCMSITSALAFGFEQKYCNGCRASQRSPYAGSSSSAPQQDFAMRPAMMLAASSFEQARALIDRGIAADGNWRNVGRSALAILVETPDAIRSVRKKGFAEAQRRLGGQLQVLHIKSRDIQQHNNLMFYFTGDRFVHNIASNNFIAGAMADHLTSAGGQLTDSPQMSAMRWLEGGATGSYGTVVEPCNWLEKFPDPKLAMQNYMQGATLIEAYWKSVVMPGQGVFIGEPLASPFRSYRLDHRGDSLLLSSPMLTDAAYQIDIADGRTGPWRPLFQRAEVSVARSIELPLPASAFYRIKAITNAVVAPLW